jgi:hypothetical protein
MPIGDKIQSPIQSEVRNAETITSDKEIRNML